jgi:hypothetical protein
MRLNSEPDFKKSCLAGSTKSEKLIGTDRGEGLKAGWNGNSRLLRRDLIFGATTAILVSRAFFLFILASHPRVCR